MKRIEKQLPKTEDLDFHYLLTLMPALQEMPEYAWLPELYSIIGYDTLVELCGYCGGETLTLPTIDELSDSIDALQWYYDVYISKKMKYSDIPEEYKKLVCKIRGIFNAGNSQA